MIEPLTDAVNVEAVAVVEVLSWPPGLVPCQYHDTFAGGVPFFESIFGPQVFVEINGVVGATGNGFTTASTGIRSSALDSHPVVELYEAA